MELPQDVWIFIFSYAPGSILSLRKTCKNFYALTDSEKIAKLLVEHSDPELKHILEKKEVTGTREILTHIIRHSRYKHLRFQFEQLEEQNAKTEEPMQMVQYIDTEKNDNIAAYFANRVLRITMGLVKFNIKEEESLIWYSYTLKHPFSLGPQWRIASVAYELVICVFLFHWYMDFYEPITDLPNTFVDISNKVPQAGQYTADFICNATIGTINYLESNPKELEKIFPGLGSIKKKIKLSARGTSVFIKFPESMEISD